SRPGGGDAPGKTQRNLSRPKDCTALPAILAPRRFFPPFRTSPVPRGRRNSCPAKCRRLCQRAGKGVKEISPDFFEALSEYPWPGNVRELFHALEMALAVAGESPALFPHHLPNHIRIKLSQQAVEKQVVPEEPPSRPEHPEPPKTLPP
ncbi:MAG: hypothetical protein GY859_22185, partial [Desulfobacterales bacterium]|nr:hypothetical protein [Desulfobacterales bacterium]